ncbi:hypothetical protein [Methyloceanibacter stevinii]|uniref:hypothetical protein n=1 Tax=Methyloceanibacter stevinii TaxID=1774970 RepID=UPI001301590C|nr:hypothetical protein [Methyloceanibacter stevinii]
MSTIDDLVRQAKRLLKPQRKAFYAKVEREHGKAVADGLRKTVEGTRERVKWPK